jgi:hypothetical protein
MNAAQRKSPPAAIPIHGAPRPADDFECSQFGITNSLPPDPLAEQHNNPPQAQDSPQALEEPTRPASSPALAPVTVAELVDNGPELNEPIVEGVFRAGEIVNVISGSKSYKTYLILALLLCIAAGRPWLGLKTRRVRVLLLDNELHAGVLRQRIKAVASALAIDVHEVADSFEVLSLRGQLRDIRQMGSFFRGIKPGYYGVVALDSWYRMIPGDIDENSNSAMTQLYNLLDHYAAMIRSAFVLVHHSTKGRQGEKAITDVGAGAGAMSRAADCHLILRAHSQEDCAVLESALRSFAPMAAIGLRWMYPTWTLAGDIDVTDLKRDRTGRRQAAVKPAKEPPKQWTVAEFVVVAVDKEPRPKGLVVAKARTAKIPTRQVDDLLALAEASGAIHRWLGKTGRELLYSTEPPALFTGSAPQSAIAHTHAPPHTPRVRERNGGCGRARDKRNVGAIGLPNPIAVPAAEEGGQ